MVFEDFIVLGLMFFQRKMIKKRFKNMLIWNIIEVSIFGPIWGRIWGRFGVENRSKIDMKIVLKRRAKARRQRSSKRRAQHL